MKVEVIENFIDKTTKKTYKVGDVVELSDERAKTLTDAKLVKTAKAEKPEK